ncbi:MAG TPA: tyrosine--tRNA ligase [Candidatus Paceibacterota bacterium]
MSLSEELIARGFIHQYSSESLAEILDGPKRTIYHGVDPTADSIHAGNFASWMLLRHLASAGHHIILLVGGGTGMIGDPKPDVERPLTPPEVVAKRVEKLKAQAERLLAGQPITFVNNHDWLEPLKLIDFLRDIGKHFTVNELIKKDAIANRLKSDNGISYTEFAYPLLQAYDYLELHKKHKCDVQVGGSDQWGNIIAGVELVRKKLQKTVYAITIPLIIDKSTGKKFGKSEGNAVWLDAEKTSPYAFYQFWLNVSDDNVIDYLKIFTFLSLSEIGRIEEKFRENPGARSAQKILAFEITQIVHGKGVATKVEEVSNILFGQGSLKELSASGKEELLQNAPTTKVGAGTLVIDVLVETKLSSSKREARTFIESGAISINDRKILDLESTIDAAEFIDGLAILRRGKKQVHILTL